MTLFLALAAERQVVRRTPCPRFAMGATVQERLRKATASLTGLSVGDAFGDRFFANPSGVERLIEERAVPSPPWRFTDDTVMALSIVGVLTDHGAIDEDVLADFFQRDIGSIRREGTGERLAISRGYRLASSGANRRCWNTHPIARRVPASPRRLGCHSTTTSERPSRHLADGTKVISQDTVPFCIWSAARHLRDFEEAMWSTVSGLGDRNTTCAIVGGIIATDPRVVIPPEWLEARESLDRMSAICSARDSTRSLDNKAFQLTIWPRVPGGRIDGQRGGQLAADRHVVRRTRPKCNHPGLCRLPRTSIAMDLAWSCWMRRVMWSPRCSGTTPRTCG